MTLRDGKEVERILERLNATLIKLETKRANCVSQMHRKGREVEKIDMLIEKLTGKPVEKPKVEISHEKS